jgi:hypothetical protein
MLDADLHGRLTGATERERETMKKGVRKMPPYEALRGADIPLWGPYSIHIKRVKEILWQALRPIGFYRL